MFHSHYVHLMISIGHPMCPRHGGGMNHAMVDGGWWMVVWTMPAKKN